MDANDFQAEIKSALKDLPIEHRKALNAGIWDLSKKLAATTNRELREAVKAVEDAEKEKRKSGDTPLDEEERRLRLELKLDSMLDDPKTSAADIKELRDYFGLGGKKADISFSIVDFKDVYPEMAGAIDVAAKAISIAIEEANEG
jgi:hypothetical protein